MPEPLRRVRTPPKKPAEPFGTINFGKDGSVRREVQKLSQVKHEQELSVGQRFAMSLNHHGKTAGFLEQLPENDHDFAIADNGSRVIVQAAEVNDRVFLRPVTRDDYREARTGFKHFQKGPGEQYFGIDIEARNEAIANVLRGKLAKAYQKPTDSPLWLVIWSSGGVTGPTFLNNGTLTTREPFVRAARVIAETGSGPFAEVWYFHLLTGPARIDAALLRLPVEAESEKWSVALTPMTGRIVGPTY